jgi:hypothetical protein
MELDEGTEFGWAVSLAELSRPHRGALRELRRVRLLTRKSSRGLSTPYLSSNGPLHSPHLSSPPQLLAEAQPAAMQLT